MPAPGDWVLIGLAGITMPGDWLLARVLWADGSHVCTSREVGGYPQRDVFELGLVLAFGDCAGLRALQEDCRKRVQDERDRVHELDRQLTAARGAVWRKLDEETGGLPRKRVEAPAAEGSST